MTAKVRRIGPGPEFATPVRVIAAGAVVGSGVLNDAGDIELTLAPSAEVTSNTPGAALSAKNAAAQSVPSGAATAVSVPSSVLLDGPIFTRLNNARFRADLPYPVRFDVQAMVTYAGSGSVATSRVLQFCVYRGGALVESFRADSGTVVVQNTLAVGGTIQLQHLDELELQFTHDTVAPISANAVALSVTAAQLGLSQVASSPDGAAQTALAAAAAAALAVQQVNAAAGSVTAPGAASRGRNTNFAVPGNSTWLTVPLDVAVFADALFFSYETATNSLIPSFADQERIDIRAVARFAKSAGGTIRKMRVIAVNPANPADIQVPIEKEVAPSANADSVIDISNISLPPKNWKLQLQVQHDYAVATVPQNINITGAVLSVASTRGKGGPPGVAIRDTVSTRQYTAAEGDTDFAVPEGFDTIVVATVGGCAQTGMVGFPALAPVLVRFDSPLKAGDRVLLVTARSPVGQASLLRPQVNQLAAGATFIQFDDPVDVVMVHALGGVVQAPGTDFNVNYALNRLEYVTPPPVAARATTVYRRTATVG